MADNKRLKLPRATLAKITGNDPQAIKAFEGMQSQVFEQNPAEIKVIFDSIAEVMAQTIQATIIAHQVAQEQTPYLQAVGVPIESSFNLNPVNLPHDETNYLVTV
ncbi:hypothetical protein [Psychrobacter pygoscelis]|uniref:hypothetical protein n=1 Tax=Psychrobacter pygoscelis TaxID=2488563 RepID=UPI00103EA5B0|nr:hypothetical protein [Psychrobacter pygoscelis]